MKRFLIWAAALPILLALFIAGCSQTPPRTTKQTRDEARQAAEAAQNKALATDAERRQNAASDSAPEDADAHAHQHPDHPDQDEEMDK
jgi:PBP1b-binding outer membrane lipoprotein LpoB